MMTRRKTYQQKITRWLLTLALALTAIALNGQELSLAVSPTQEILPPQIGMYVASPEKFFRVWVSNNTEETQNVFFGLQLEEVTAGNDLVASSRVNHMPRQPIVIPAGQTKPLSAIEMHNLFNYLPSSDIFIRNGIFKEAKNGVYGLMPEGTYQIRLTAYKWDPTLTTPVALNNPNDGACLFRVCYSAQAPKFIQPVFMMDQGELNDYNIAILSTLNPMIAWTQPVMACSPQVQFTYELRIIEQIPGQAPDDALENGAAVYQKAGLLNTNFMLPQSTLNKLKKDKTYAAQVIATTNTQEGDMNYVYVNNDGKSSWLQFRVTDGMVDVPDVVPEEEDSLSGMKSLGGNSDPYADDSLYVFRVPKLTKPEFVEGQARKVFMGEDIPVEWRKTWFEGGRGERQDTIKWKYSVQLYKGSTSEEYTEIFARKPIFSADTTELKSKIPWDKIEKQVEKSDFLILRVKPTCTNEKSIRVIEDSTNIKTFAIVDRLSQVFKCTGGDGVTQNLVPTTKKLEKGQKIGIGAYNMTLDETPKQDSKTKSFSGRGHIAWNPGGLKIGVAVKFDSLYINSDNLVYKGTCVSYPREEDKTPSNGEMVDELFSDWGLDNIIGDTQIPYAGQIQEGINSYGVEGLKKGADALNLNQYYSYYKLGTTAWNDLTNGEISDCHMPLQVPKEYNTSPVDIMIAGMTFSPTTAYMNMIGMFQMPGGEEVDSILVFGAPALCMNPESLIPESGMMALISNFTLKDPNSKFKFTFKAPNDVTDPTNGCFLKWEDKTIDVFNAEIEMRIPGLKRVEGDDVLDETPRLNLSGRIRNWSNWMMSATMDPFQAEDLPGWTFLPGAITYDHSLKENPTGFKFPARYNKANGGCGTEDRHWEGLYIHDMQVRFPKVIAFDSDTTKQAKLDEAKGSTKAIAIALDYMMCDRSGVSCSFGLKNMLNATCGDWKITIDKVNCDVVHSHFDNCGFEGKFTIPLLRQAKANKEGKHDVAEIAYQCKMYVQEKADQKGKEAVYIFATTQTCDVSLDFFLATAVFDQKQTYFLVEATDEETKVELCMGGHLTIASSDKYKLKIPDIKFSRMRLANCARWKSKYLKTNADLYQNIVEAKDANSTPGQGAAQTASGSSGNAGATTAANNTGTTPPAANNAAGGSGGAAGNQAANNAANDDKNVFYDGKEFVNDDKTVYFDIGKWSHSSPEKSFCGFTFSLEKFGMVQNGDLVGLQIGGKMKCLSGKLTAGATVTVNAKVDMASLDIAYGGIKFDGAEVGGEFGGVKIEGKFTMPEDETGEGVEAELDLTMPGDLFVFHAKGAWMEKEKDAEEQAKDQKAWDAKSHSPGEEYNPSKTYTWAYLVVSMSSKAGIQAPPIQINGIKGGFYFNCRNTAGDGAFDDSAGDKGAPAYGMVGGLLGLKIATTGSSKAINGDMQLTMYYDMFADRLSTISMVGTVHALTAKDPNDGMINAKAKLVYLHDETDRYLDLDITVDGKADMKDEMREFAGEAMDALHEINDKVGLEALGAQDDDPNRNSTAGSDESVTEGKDNFEASMGFHVSMNFRVTWVRNGLKLKPVKWHLYIGRPPHKERCELRLIDFKMGDKDDAFALWASIGANAYLCLGNELVDEDGNEYALPEIPETISKFLNGGDINGDQQHLSTEAEQTRQGTIKEFKESGLNARSDGGVMFGASAWGDFGANAGIVYARATLMAGFDIALKKLKDGQRCIGGKEMGSKGGYYGTGQVYAYAAGEIGLLINCWLFKGKVPLVDAGLGALLKGGFPNPSWAYGKMKARYRLLGGLIKGSTTVEMKVGEVCMPEFGNPLDDIKIFEDMQPGYEDDPEMGFAEENAISPLTAPRFTTNMVIDRHLRLLDKNVAFQMADFDEEIEKYGAQASRTYVFHLDPAMQMDIFDEPDPSIKKDAGASRSYKIGYTTKNHSTFSLGTGSLEVGKGYRVRLMGYAKEIVNGREIDPIFNDESTGYRNQSKEWRDTVTYFFRTNDVPPPVNDAVAIFHTRYADDLRKPMLAMKYSYADMINDPDQQLTGRLEVWNEEHQMWLCPDIKVTTKTYDINGNEVTASSTSSTTSSSSSSSGRTSVSGILGRLGATTSSLNSSGPLAPSGSSNPVATTGNLVTTTKTEFSKPNSESEYYDLELDEINQDGYIFITTKKTLNIVEKGKAYRFSLNLIDRKKMNNVLTETVDKFTTRKRKAASGGTSGGNTYSERTLGSKSKTGSSSSSGKTSLLGSKTGLSNSKSSGFSLPGTTSSGNTSSSSTPGKYTALYEDQPSDVPTVSLNSYMDDLRAEVEKEMGEDADTTSHIKFKEQYDKANYSTTLYVKESSAEDVWVGANRSGHKAVHSTYNNFLEWVRAGAPAESTTDSYVQSQLKSVNYKVDPIKSTVARLVTGKDYLKTPYGVMGYWLSYGLLGGITLRDNLFFNDIYYLSSEGLKITLNNNGANERVAFRDYYGADGALPLTQADAHAAIRQNARNLQVSMDKRKYQWNYYKYNGARVIEGYISNDMNDVVNLYEELAAVKSKFLSFTGIPTTQKVNRGTKEQGPKVREFIKTYKDTWAVAKEVANKGTAAYRKATDILTFPYYQIPAIFLQVPLANWRSNDLTRQTVWEGINNAKPTRADMRSNIESITYEAYRITTYYSGIGYTEDTRLGVREEDREDNVYEYTIKNAQLTISK